MVVFFKAVVKRIGAHRKCDPDHQVLKPDVFDDIDPKQRQAGKEKWQQRTMNGAGQ